MYRDKDKEYIICAAINYSTYEQKNGQIGLVICGRRHHDCIHTYFELTNTPTRKPHDIQGFMTSKNRFVDRAEAYLIAKEQGQLLLEDEKERILMSEDLY